MRASLSADPVRAGVHAGLAVAALTVVTFFFAQVAWLSRQSFYFRTVLEDSYLEWATVFALLAAAVMYTVAAWCHRQLASASPWFLLCLAAFCGFTAMEEISWGQRLLGFAPPDYFLEANYQQEFNFHNLIPASIRQMVLIGILVGYGVVLPLMALSSSLRRRLRSLGIIESPVGLIPVSLLNFSLLIVDPWTFANEWVEFVLGFTLLFAGLATVRHLAAPHSPSESPSSERRVKDVRLARQMVGAWLASIVLGVSTSATSVRDTAADEQLQVLASSEVVMLAHDLLVQMDDPCLQREQLHGRMGNYSQIVGSDALSQGEFRRQGSDPRMEYFLDPWQLPYWLRCVRTSQAVTVFVYSFGADRRRDTYELETQHDDVGVVLSRITPSGGAVASAEDRARTIRCGWR